MLFLVILIVGGTIFLVVSRYNALQTLAHEVREAHSNVMASMKKRVDLTNKLIDIAKGYADHEKLTHISVAGSSDVVAVGGAGVAAATALTQVLKLATQYPELKASAAYQQLMGQLDQIESDLQGKREGYNRKVKEYNTALVKLPVSLYARQLGFRTAPYFDVDSADSLEKLKGFHSDDAEHLKQILADGSRRLADGSRKIAGESVRIGKIAVDRGIEMGAELQKKHAARALEGGGASEEGYAPSAGPEGDADVASP